MTTISGATASTPAGTDVLPIQRPGDSTARKVTVSDLIAAAAGGVKLASQYASIQAAIDAAEADGGGAVVLNPTSYTLSASLKLPAKVSLIGTWGAGENISTITYTGDATLSTTVAAGTSETVFTGAAGSATDDAYNKMALRFTSGANAGEVRHINDYVASTKTFTVDEAFTATPSPGDAFEVLVPIIEPDQTDYAAVNDNCAVKTLKLDGGDKGTIGIDLRSGSQWAVEDVYVTGCGVGIRVYRSGNCYWNVIHKPYIYDCDIGIWITGSGGYGNDNAANSNAVEYGYIRGNKIGVHVEKANEIMLFGVGVQQSTVVGYKIEGTNVRIIGGRIENNQTPAINITANADKTLIFFPHVSQIDTGGPVYTDNGSDTVIFLNDLDTGLSSTTGDHIKIGRIFVEAVKALVASLDLDFASTGKVRLGRTMTDAAAAESGNLFEIYNNSASLLFAVDYLGRIPNAQLTQANLIATSELTIASGIVTATRTRHRIDTESDAASDDLDTINGGTDGDLLILQGANAARVVTVKDAVDNIQLAGSDFDLNHPLDTLTLMYDGTNSMWVEISRASNSGVS